MSEDFSEKTPVVVDKEVPLAVKIDDKSFKVIGEITSWTSSSVELISPEKGEYVKIDLKSGGTLIIFDKKDLSPLEQEFIEIWSSRDLEYFLTEMKDNNLDLLGLIEMYPIIRKDIFLEILKKEENNNNNTLVDSIYILMNRASVLRAT